MAVKNDRMILLECTSSTYGIWKFMIGTLISGLSISRTPRSLEVLSRSLELRVIESHLYTLILFRLSISLHQHLQLLKDCTFYFLMCINLEYWAVYSEILPDTMSDMVPNLSDKEQIYWGSPVGRRLLPTLISLMWRHQSHHHCR